MNRSELKRSSELKALRRAVDSDIVIVRNDAPDENIEMRQLRLLFIGMVGMIVADVLILAYFWAI